VTVAPGGVGAEWVSSMLTPTDNCPGERHDFKSLAPAISMSATIWAVAKTRRRDPAAMRDLGRVSLAPKPFLQINFAVADHRQVQA